MKRLEMKNRDKIGIKKQQKISAYPQAKLISINILQEILYTDQSQKIQQTKFACLPFGKVFEKQIKTIEDQRKNQVEA